MIVEVFLFSSYSAVSIGKSSLAKLLFYFIYYFILFYYFIHIALTYSCYENEMGRLFPGGSNTSKGLSLIVDDNYDHHDIRVVVTYIERQTLHGGNVEVYDHMKKLRTYEYIVTSHSERSYLSDKSPQS